MPMLRKRGGTCTPRSGAATSSPPIAIMPPVGCSRPAIMRSVVVLPHPDGPSTTTISPPRRAEHHANLAGRYPKGDIVDGGSADEKLLAQVRDDQFSGHSNFLRDD